MLQKLSQEQILKKSMRLIADAYNVSRGPIFTIDVYPERERNRNLHFINKMARVLEVDISKETKEFKEKMGKAYDSMRVYYRGKVIPDDEKENLKIVQAIEIPQLPYLPVEWVLKRLANIIFPISPDLYKAKLDCYIFFKSSGILEKVFEKKVVLQIGLMKLKDWFLQ